MRKFILISSFFWVSLSSAQQRIGAGVDIGNNTTYTGMELLDSMVKQSQLIIMGEDYSYAGFNAKIEFKMLKYLNQSVGLSHYILEASPSKADLVNQYVLSGDSAVETLLKSVSSVKYMRLYKNIKKLNAKLPDSLKIHVYGVDVERNNALPLVRMSQTLPDGMNEGDVPQNLRIHVEAIQGAAKYIIAEGLKDFEREKEGRQSDYEDYFYRPQAFSVRESVNEFMKQYDSLRPQFQAWLGPRFGRFDTAVMWLEEYKQFNHYKYTAFEYSWREDAMYHRLNQLVGSSPSTTKFFLQMGLCRAGYAVVQTGCGIDRFKGAIYRLKNLPESNVKSIMTIGIFYQEEMEKDEEYRDAQHRTYSHDLRLLFDSLEENTAAFANLKKIDSAQVMGKDFDFALLDKNYPLSIDDLESDSTESDSSMNYDYSYEYDYYKDYRNARVFVGYHSLRPLLKTKATNSQLLAAGLDPIGNIQWSGGEIGFAAEDYTMFRAFAGSGSSGKNYHASYGGVEVGSALLFTRFVKAGMTSGITFVKHTISKYSSSTSGTFFNDYDAPEVFVNPAVVLSTQANVILDLSPFYIFAQGGRMFDLGSPAWKLDGNSTGSLGGLSNNGWFYNYGFGFSIPMRWLD